MNTTRKDAFSLIEVVIALGIFSFAMVGIFALIPVSMNSIRSVSNEIRANEIAETIFGIWEIAPSEMRTNTIDAIPISGITTTNAGGVSGFCIGNTNQTVYFSEDGYLVDDSDNALIVIKYRVDTNSVTNISRVELSFGWPASASTNSPLYREVSFANDFVNETPF